MWDGPEHWFLLLQQSDMRHLPGKLQHQHVTERSLVVHQGPLMRVVVQAVGTPQTIIRCDESLELVKLVEVHALSHHRHVFYHIFVFPECHSARGTGRWFFLIMIQELGISSLIMPGGDSTPDNGATPVSPAVLELVLLKRRHRVSGHGISAVETSQ